MNPIPILGIPHLNRPDILRRCLDSIDYPVSRLVIVQNGKDEDMPSLENLPHWIQNITVIKHPNAGVAGSWNEIIKLFPAPYWMISNNDILFTSGALQKMAQAGELQGQLPSEYDDRQPAGMLFGHAASFFVITVHGVMNVGTFDENCFPAYLEDCDWHRRANLLGVRTENVDGVCVKHGDHEHSGSMTVNSSAELMLKNKRTHGGNFWYYREKWGGENHQETYTRPFNDPHWPLWAWKFDPLHRANQQW